MGGGVSLDLSNWVKSSTASQFPATVGKTYFVATSSLNESNLGVNTGATVISQNHYTAYNAYHYCGLVKATGSTVYMKGSGNDVYYLEV